MCLLLASLTLTSAKAKATFHASEELYDEEDFDEDQDIFDENFDELSYNQEWKVDLCTTVKCKPHQKCIVSGNGANCVDISAIGKFKKTEKSCKDCPQFQVEYFCGSDNETYPSLCWLRYQNCIHNRKVLVSCSGPCPCIDEESTLRKIHNPRNIDRKHQQLEKYRRTQRKRQEHEAKKVCTSDELEAMGDRLKRWFTVVVRDQQRYKRWGNNKKSSKLDAFKMPLCEAPTTWMFHHLDVNNDYSLSLKELFELEHDEREKCLKQYLDSCDEDGDTFLNPYEWCSCFEEQKPCEMVKRKHSKRGLVGAYVPSCDSKGYYTPVQCHSSSGLCWCVDKNGIEYSNTRQRGQPKCGSRKQDTDGDSDADSETDEDSDEENDGSGDKRVSYN